MVQTAEEPQASGQLCLYNRQAMIKKYFPLSIQEKDEVEIINAF